MPNKEIFIEIEGPDAHNVANELAEQIRLELGEKPRQTPPEHAVFEDNTGKKADPAVIGAVAAVSCVVLAIPPALVAAMDIKDRLTKKKRTERIIEKGRFLKENKQVSTIRFRIGPAEISFEKADYAKIADEVERLSKE